MKTKFLLTALAIPALFAACSEDDFATSPIKDAEVNGQFVELGKDFAIGLTREASADTKTSWHYEGKGGILYSWLPTFEFTADDAVTVNAENIGFAWRGEGAGDAKVRTNYKFALSGFLKNGETTPKTKICDDEVLVLNGYTFEKDEAGNIVANASNSEATAQLKGYDESTIAMTNSSYSVKYGATGYSVEGAKVTTIPDVLNAGKLAEEDPYVRNGIFTTNNSTIFKGEYIVYFPYNPSFAEVDYLPATSPVQFTQDMANPNLVAHLAGKTFGYGKATITKGGSMAESFTTTNLSSIIDFKVTNKSGDVARIAKVILVDEGEGAKGFIKSVGLDASKIGTATGSDLYVGEPTYEPTLVLNIVTTKTDGTELAYAYLQDKLAKEFTIAALPTKLVKPVVYLMDNKGYCCRKELDTTEGLVAGKGTQWAIELTKDDKFNLNLAVDTKSLIEMMSKAGAGSEDNAVVKVLGNITLDPNAQIKLANASSETALKNLFATNEATSIYIAKNVTVDGTGTITVPADLTLTFKAVEGKTLTFNNPVVIESAGCCGKTGANVLMQSTIGKKGNYVFNGDVENFGTMYLANNALATPINPATIKREEAAATTVTFNGDLLNGMDEFENKGVINCFGLVNSVINMNGAVTNNGKINIEEKVMQLADGQVDEFVQGMGITKSVEVNAGKLTNNGDILVGRYTTLNTKGAVANNGTVVVETAGTNEDNENGNWTVPSGAVANAGLVENHGVINIIGTGSMANTSAKAEFVDHVGSQIGGAFPKADMGEYICDVDDEDVTANGDRLGYAMGPVIPTTTIRFIGDGNTKDNNTDGYIYNLNGYKTNNVLPYNFIIAAESNVKLISLNDKKVAQPVSINKLTVNSILNLSGIKLTAKDVVTVNKEMTVNPMKADVKTREASEAFIAEKNVNVGKNATFTVAKFVMTDLNANLTVGEGAKAIFDYATFTDVQNKVTVNAKGTFTRKVATGGSDAIAAEVYCASFDIPNNSSVTEGYPVVRGNK